ncbi:DUF4232 domain-containing protein [Streptomyces sp. SID13726]|uniref:DUF4232 domain-containing protein n=1 Tax=Streptomyces sp. SID13726 TaxID=2706058 RepID=UPI0013BA7FDD|nr:DUF4232 domain-containing protein [Streptomyces sp. SID13726]NEB00374.1 DUF4232 domain-containing protein [Streptomyces sp. SID13726]
MSSFRTARTRLAGTAATAVLAALSLTACSDGTGTHDEGAALTGSVSGSTSGSASGSPSGSTGSGAAADSAGSEAAVTSKAPATAKAPATSKVPASSAKPVTCEGSNTRTVAAPLNRPVNHMLLTVTNTGSRTCFLYGYPSVRFTDAQSEPPVIEDSQPQAVVTLQPGESGYASVNLSATDGSGSNGYTADSLTVYFYGRSMSGSVGAAARPSLPAKGVYIDDSIKVTYWQQSMDDAVSW